MNIIDQIEKENLKGEVPSFAVGVIIGGAFN